MAEASKAKKVGRLAGLAYLAVIVFSAPGYMILTQLLAGSPQTELARLAANQTLFSLALLSSAIGFAAWAPLGLLLYRLMSFAGRIAGLVMLILALAGVAANLIALAQLLPLAGSPDSRMDAATLAPIVQSYQRLLLFAQVFSGAWLFPFGWLVLRSRVAPWFLGVGLLAGGVFYSMVFATAFEPGLVHTAAYRILSPITGILGEVVGELGICLWLLIKGAGRPKAAADHMSPRTAFGPAAGVQSR